jgi:dipeptidyl aminopeptidase/acylaminoacyl peptidase
VGVASLRFDFYGSGESDGEFRHMTRRGEIADGCTAVAFLRTQKGIDPKRNSLLGLSLGGAVAATLAPGVQAKAPVLWSTVAHTARLGDIVKKTARKIPGKPGAFGFDARELHPRLMVDVLNSEPIRHMVRYKGPTLIIHPEWEESVTVSHARDFFHAAGSATKEVAITAGADHVFTAVRWEQEVIARSVQWFGRRLQQHREFVDLGS